MGATPAAPSTTRKRRRLHLAAGEALERQPQRREKRAVELARHFLLVEDQERALRWSLEAGDQAEAVFAHAELNTSTARRSRWHDSAESAIRPTSSAPFRDIGLMNQSWCYRTVTRSMPGSPIDR